MLYNSLGLVEVRHSKRRQILDQHDRIMLRDSRVHGASAKFKMDWRFLLKCEKDVQNRERILSTGQSYKHSVAMLNHSKVLQTCVRSATCMQHILNLWAKCLLSRKLHTRIAFPQRCKSFFSAFCTRFLSMPGRIVASLAARFV